MAAEETFITGPREVPPPTRPGKLRAMVELRNVRHEDIPGLVALDGATTRKEWHQILGDPWITVTVAEEDGALCGWVMYSVDDLRSLVLRADLWATDAAAELYGEAYRHWRTAATGQPRTWVTDDDPARPFLITQGWQPSGRTRRIPHRITEFALLVTT